MQTKSDPGFEPQGLLHCVLDHRALVADMRRFKASYFEKTFADYSAACKPVFTALDEYLTHQGETGAQDVAETFIDDLNAVWQEDERYKSSAARKAMEDADRTLVALYLVPALRALALPSAEDFCRILQETWVRRSPKAPFYLGTYGGITESFKKRPCFITTALCDYQGKPDDCAELRTLRAFRDGWLTNSDGGEALVREYYEIAPAIVTLMTLCGDREAECSRLSRTYLEPCLRSLEEDRPRECRDTYVRMVRELENKYFQH